MGTTKLKRKPFNHFNSQVMEGNGSYRKIFGLDRRTSDRLFTVS